MREFERRKSMPGKSHFFSKGEEYEPYHVSSITVYDVNDKLDKVMADIEEKLLTLPYKDAFGRSWEFSRTEFPKFIYLRPGETLTWREME